MKIVTLITSAFLWVATLAKAQTTIRFVPENPLKNGTEQPFGRGRIEQTGQGVTQKLRIELPQKTLSLTLKPSRLKEYDHIFTSEGQEPSKVDFFEATDNGQKYYVTAIDHQFYGLLMVEDGDFVSLEKSNDSLYSYQKMSPNGALGYSCNHDHQPVAKTSASARVGVGLLSGCYEFPVGFVCDYAHYRFLNQNRAEVEADNLLKLAAAQEIWGPYVFNANISFIVIGQVIQTNEMNSPWTTDSRKSLATVWGEFHNSWLKPADWKKHKSLILAGITGINFGNTPNELSTWGYGGGGQNEFGMGTVVLKNFPDAAQTRWLFAHELGHAFGAGHDEFSGYVMFPQYGAASWSPKSKETINGTLGRLETQNLLAQCAVINLRYEVKKDSLAMAWQTNYDALGDSFVIELSVDAQKTWATIGTFPSAGVSSYQKTLAYSLPMGTTAYFRVHQRGQKNITSNVVTVSITGLENDPLDENVSIYPNPFFNQLSIKTLTPQSVVIYDLTGREILRIATPKNHHIIDAASWNSGNYFIQLNASASKVYKVVK
jgi:hypothetical protein